MSVQSEINRISANVIGALEEIAAKGVDVPSGSNSNNLTSLIRAIPSGCDVMIVRLSFDEDSGTYSSDKNAKEIIEAIQSGKNCVVRTEIESEGQYDFTDAEIKYGYIIGDEYCVMASVGHNYMEDGVTYGISEYLLNFFYSNGVSTITDSENTFDIRQLIADTIDSIGSAEGTNY